MEHIDKFCRTLDRDDWEVIPKPIQKLFYALSIYCNTRHKGRSEAYQKVLKYYNYLLLSVGVYDRVYMTKMVGMKAAQYIPDHMKGRLKAQSVRSLINKYQVPPDSVYFYDDIPKTVGIVGALGVNAVLVNNGLNPDALELLVRKKEYDPSSVKMVLLDFDKTLSVQKVKKQIHKRDIDYIVTRYMGGWDRLRLLFKHLKRLEELGVNVGIVTLNVEYRIRSLLERIGWIPTNTV
jgi:hypothetical protein